MAIVTRYFAAAGAGAGDGTSWANRAALFTGGAWSTVITGFNFSGSDSLECRINGTSTVTVTLSAGLFANPPTAANNLFMRGCDGSGNLLVATEGWYSNQGVFDDSAFPIVATTTNITTSSLANCIWRCVKATATARVGAQFAAGVMDWCSVVNSSNNSAVQGISGTRVSNSMISMTGAAFSYALSYDAGTIPTNVLLLGVTGSSGSRNGLTPGNADVGSPATQITVVGFGGNGVAGLGTSATRFFCLEKCTIVGNGGDGVQLASTASQTSFHRIIDCQITGNGGYGINPNGQGHVFVGHCRLRDNTSGNLNSLLNYPTDFDNYTTDSDDATEYVNSGSGDYQIKTTAATWGKGFGVSDEVPTGGSGALMRPVAMNGGLV